MQHHGAPTRLLDFTRSFYIASFFAVESITDEASIWAINICSIIEKAKQKYKIKTNLTISEIEHNFESKFNKLYRQNYDKKGIMYLEPHILYERLCIQQGLFLAPMNLNVSFKENLFSFFNSKCKDEIHIINSEDKINEIIINPVEDCVLKIIIPYSCTKDILNDLKSMNINHSTLFPGLDGFAKSLKFHL